MRPLENGQRVMCLKTKEEGEVVAVYERTQEVQVSFDTGITKRLDMSNIELLNSQS